MDKHILIVDDEQNLTYFLKEGLKKEGYHVEVGNSLAEGREKLAEFQPDLLLLDLNLPDGYGLDFYKEIRDREEFIPTVVITAHSSIQSAIDAMKLGVDDYIAKPFDIKELSLLINSMFERYHLKNELNYYRRQAKDHDSFDFFISDLPFVQKLQHMALKIAEVPVSTVLIEGATGTGKEMMARYIHNNSAQAEQPFVEINCASLPETLLESELFGYEAGAFTDAKKRKAGLIELADGGTLFLDEIGEMSLPLQAKLLRFLENHTFKRLGGVKDLKVQLRVIAATNRDMEELVRAKQFREDLFYRLNIFRIQLPTLIERREEILLLAQFFLEKLNKKLNRKIKFLSQECKKVIMKYDWPGNLRELHNVLERAVILSSSDTIEPILLPVELKSEDATSASALPGLASIGERSLKEYLNDIEFTLVKQALEISEGNQVKAAGLLGEPRHIVRYLLKKHNIPAE